MTPHVMKRDGCKVPFNSERIQEAILRAAKAAGVDDADYCATVAEVVSQQMQGRAQVDINEIQTAVENQLMSGPYKQLARAYIEYRHDRDSQREKRGVSIRRSAASSSRPTPRCSTKTPIKTVKSSRPSATCWPGSSPSTTPGSTCCPTMW